MSELKPIRIGTRVTEYPALTHNALIEGEVKRRGTLLAIDDTRKPKQKLPVVARLIWQGATAIDPGRTLKLGDAVFDPSADESAPYRGLAFFVSDFAGGDFDAPYAIAMGPIAAGNVTPAVGYGVIPGVWWAKVNVTNASHTHATPTSGTLLASGIQGERILWKEPGTGEKWALVLTGRDKFRLIRGQSYGVQSGTNILLDNIVELSGGLDPSHGAPAAQVSVYNLFGATFADNEWVDAVYSPGATGSSDWETLKSSTGTERYRLIQGKCVGAVAADAAAFSIDTIVPLAGGLDPRTVPGDMSETLSIANAQAETFVDNEDVIAVYFDLGGGVTGWSTLITERFRAIRGTWYSGSGTLQIKSVVPLGNGLDPRTDPTDGDEIVEVINTPGDTYSSGDKVYADWDATSEVWEARPKSSGGTSGALRWGIINSAGSASSTAGTPSTDGTIDLFAAFGGDTGVSFNNYYPDEAPSGAVGCIDASSNIVTWSCGTF